MWVIRSSGKIFAFTAHELKFAERRARKQKKNKKRNIQTKHKLTSKLGKREYMKKYMRLIRSGKGGKPITQLKYPKAIFDRLKNEKYWKRATKSVTVASRKDAERIQKALIIFCGGAKITKTKRGFRVHSKGYSHHVGA